MSETEFVIIHINYWGCDVGIYIALTNGAGIWTCSLTSPQGKQMCTLLGTVLSHTAG